MNTRCFNSLCWAECIVCVHFHIKAFGDTSYITTNITESKNTNFLAHQFGACLAIIETTYSIYQQTKYKFSNSIRVLSRSIFYNNILLLCIGCINRVITSTCTNNYLQLFSCVKYFWCNFIRAYNHCISIFYCFKQFSFLCIFFKQNNLMSCILKFCCNTLHCRWCKWFFSCN